MRYLLFLLLLISSVAYSQSNVDFRGDSARFYKNGGSMEVVIRNNTRDSTNGVLTNIGNGVTKFLKFRVSNDSLFLGNVFIGLIGGGGGDSAFINFDLPPGYVIVDGDTTDVNVRQYLQDSVIYNQYSAKEAKSAWIERIRTDSGRVNASKQQGTFSVNDSANAFNFLPDGRLQVGFYNPNDAELTHFKYTLTNETGSNNRYFFRVSPILNYGAGNYTYGNAGVLSKIIPTASVSGVNYAAAYGGYFYVSTEGQANINNAYGVRALAFNEGSGTVQNNIGVNIEHANTGTGTVVRNIGLKIGETGNTGGGTMLYNYGIKIENQNGKASGTNYSIFSEGGKAYFQDTIGVNDSTPLDRIHVRRGSVRVEANATGQGFSIYRESGNAYIGSLTFGSQGGSNVMVLDGANSRVTTLTNSGGSNLLQFASTNTGIYGGINQTGSIGAGRLLFPARLSGFSNSTNDAIQASDSANTRVDFKVDRFGNVLLLDSNWRFTQSNKFLGYGTTSPAAPIHIVAGGTGMVIESTGLPGIAYRKSTSGSYVTNGSTMGRTRATPYDGGSYSTTVAQMVFAATQNHSAGKYGSDIYWSTTPNDSSVSKNVMRLQQSGNLVIGSSDTIQIARLDVIGATNTTGLAVSVRDSSKLVTLMSVTNDGKTAFGTNAPNASAKVEIASTTQGFLPPRMTATQASAISSPAEGLMVYVTDTNGTFTSKGWWGYNGAAWEKLNN